MYHCGGTDAPVSCPLSEATVAGLPVLVTAVLGGRHAHKVGGEPLSHRRRLGELGVASELDLVSELLLSSRGTKDLAPKSHHWGTAAPKSRF